MINLFWRLVAKLLARPAIADWLIARAQRTPYLHIMSADCTEMYMGRWWLFNPYSRGTHKPALWWCPWSFRIHHIMRPDEDRDLHDHPWNARTIILRGLYTEQRQASNEWKRNVLAGMVSKPDPKWVDWIMKDACEWIRRDQAEERINERQDELREVNQQLEQFRARCHGIKNLSAIESRDDQLAVAQLKINELQHRLNAADQRLDELGTQLAESRMITLSGCEFSEHELIRTAVRMVTGTSRRGTQRWVAMKDAFCCGSGVAHALCRRFGYDPDEMVKP